LPSISILGSNRTFMSDMVLAFSLPSVTGSSDCTGRCSVHSPAADQLVEALWIVVATPPLNAIRHVVAATRGNGDLHQPPLRLHARLVRS
jgi:hypothetical protein